MSWLDRPRRIEIHVYQHGAGGNDALAELTAKVNTLLGKVEAMSVAVQERLVKITEEVSQVGTVVDSAVAAIGGVAEIISDLRADLEARGVTTEQLVGLDEAESALEAHKTKLAEAIANIPTSGTGTGTGSGGTPPTP